MNIQDRRYRIIPVVLGNRCEAWKLQHMGFFGWRDTKFGDGKVIVSESNKNELLDLVKHLHSKIKEL